MDFIRSLTNSFRAINKMGNEASSPSKTQQDEQEKSSKRRVDSPKRLMFNPNFELVWHPNDISSSDSEDQTIVVKSGQQSKQPDSPQAETRKPQPRKRQRKPKAEATIEVEGVSGAVDKGHVDGVEERASLLHRERATIDATASGPAGPVASQHDADDLQPDKPLPQVTPPNEQSTGLPRTDNTHGGGPIGSKALSKKSQGEKARYPCPEAAQYDCDKTFSTKTIANRHLKTHLRQPELTCPVCEKTYSRADKLKAHKSTHTHDEIEASIIQHQSQQEQQQVGVEDGDEDINASVAVEAAKSGAVETQPHQEPQTLSEEVLEIQESVPRNNTLTEHIIVSNHPGESSAQVSTTSTSVFDEPVHREVITETPQPKSRLKRKRDIGGIDQPANFPIEKSRKRRRRHSLSPPTSISSEFEDSAASERPRDSSAESIPVSLPAISTIKARRSGNLDDFAKAWTPGSQLYHPIHNPRSPRVRDPQAVQVRIVQTSQAGPSSRLKTRTQNDLSHLVSGNRSSDSSSLVRRTSQVVYTSPKGKRRAEEGIMYSSPQTSKYANESDESESESGGLATTVARRTITKQGSRKRARSVELDHANEQSDSEKEVTLPASADKKPFTCRECSKRFASKAALDKHVSKPGVHSGFHECDDCSRKFPSLKGLKEHQKRTGHGAAIDGQARKGHFSPTELRKLENWQASFCDEYNIDIATFNQIMTDTSRRGKEFRWPYRFITKKEFLNEYFDVLPDRDRRSMARYRERAFQNVPAKQDWTAEDDEELARLVKELGPKWVEIGQLMTRTQDSVNQRWRFKVQYNGNQNQGEWLKSEEENLKEAVAEVRRASGLPLDPYADVSISWDSVSKKLDGRRTAQQCSNKWRLMYQVRKGNKFIKPSETSRRLSISSVTATPSRVTQRLAGQTSSTTQQGSSHKKRIVSKEHVSESESDEEHNLQEAEPNDGGKDSESSMRLQSAQEQSHKTQQVKEIDSQQAVEGRTSNASRVSQTSKDSIQSSAQTQANTSAPRVPNSLSRQQSQTDVGKPKSSTQQQPSAASWKPINKSYEQYASSGKGSTETGRKQMAYEIQDTTMADPPSSNAERQSTSRSPRSSSSSRISVEEKSGLSSSASDDEDDKDDEDARAQSSSASRSDTSSDSESDNSTESSDEDQESDSMVMATQKDAFVRSLQSPNSKSPLESKGQRSVGGRKGSGRVSLEQAYRGEPEDDSESDSDSGDLGDIMHH